MSHNRTSVAGKDPNVQGEITVTPEDLSDVTVTGLASGEVLTYDSTSATWKNVSGGGATISFCFIGDGEVDSASYDITGETAPFQLELYATNPVVSGSWTPTFTLKTRTGGSSTPNWIQSFTLPEGTYHLRATMPCTFTNDSVGRVMRIAWYENSAQAGTATMYVPLDGVSLNGYATTIVTSTGLESYSVYCVFEDGAVTIESAHSFIEIMKLA